MSGGVDSSVALLLLKKQGWDPVGVSLKYPVWNDPANCFRENICCSADSFRIAREVCRTLGVPHHICDVSKEFQFEVIGYFVKALKSNQTPNPCVICNRYLKFKKLFDWAHCHGIRDVATGHYARTRKNPKTGRFELLRSKDSQKDQTYSLSFISQKQLSHILFPLGGYTKQEIFAIAVKEGFKIFLKRKQSQDFCFVAGHAMDSFLRKKIGIQKGPICDASGQVLGEHEGLHFYTIGQRKGMGLSGGPFFVTGKDAHKNILFVSRDEASLLHKKVFLSPCHFLSEKPRGPMRVMAKIRYRQPASRGTLCLCSKDRSEIIFDQPQRAVTPGQFAVFYRRRTCLGGGVIQ